MLPPTETAASPVRQLVDRLLQSDRGAASRLMTIVENRRAGYSEALRLLAPHTGRAHLIGVTGPPGAGKSTLVNALIKHYREQGKSVGVIAVDPTSAVSGGALLGDRIRMLQFYQDSGVFIRSMASRGQLGGLAAATVFPIYDLARRVKTRFTFGPAVNIFPVWSTDDARIVFASNRKGLHDLYVKPTTGSGCAHAPSYSSTMRDAPRRPRPRLGRPVGGQRRSPRTPRRNARPRRRAVRR